MKKLLGIVLFVAIGLSTAYSQTTEAEKELLKQNADTLYGWKKGGMVSISFAQVSFTNWAAGGENSISGNGMVHLFGNRILEKSSWENSLDLGYGILKQKDVVKKTEDKIDFTSKYGQRIKKNTYVAGLLNLKSQFTAGYNYPNDSVAISNFLAPGYVLAAIGIDYKPKENFSIFLAPLTGKMTIVNDQDLANNGAYGVEAAVYDETTQELKTEGKKSRGEFGGYLRAMYSKDILKDVSFSTKLELFSNYLNNPQNIDVYWECLLSAKINKYIAISISTTLLYDDDITIMTDPDGDGIFDKPDKLTQFKEVLGIGFSYKF